MKPTKKTHSHSQNRFSDIFQQNAETQIEWLICSVFIVIAAFSFELIHVSFACVLVQIVLKQDIFFLNVNRKQHTFMQSCSLHTCKHMCMQDQKIVEKESEREMDGIRKERQKTGKRRKKNNSAIQLNHICSCFRFDCQPNLHNSQPKNVVGIFPFSPLFDSPYNCLQTNLCIICIAADPLRLEIGSYSLIPFRSHRKNDETSQTRNYNKKNNPIELYLYFLKKRERKLYLQKRERKRYFQSRG